VRAADLAAAADVVETSERPAQARLVLEQGALAPPPGTAWLTLAIRPVPPPSQPADGTIEGNVYRITVTADSGTAVPVRRGGGVHIWLRGTGAVGRHLIERYTGGAWGRQTTHRAGTSHVYFADVTGLGDFALVVPGERASGSSGVSPLSLVTVGIIAVLLLGTLILLVRLRRRSSSAPHPPGPIT
jgi:hypothetical protein